MTIALSNKLHEALENYNAGAKDENRISLYDILDEMGDCSDEKEMRKVIEEIKECTKN